MNIDVQRLLGSVFAMMVLAFPIGAQPDAGAPNHGVTAVQIVEPDPSTTAEAPEGHLVVRWRADEDAEDLRFELQISSKNDFTGERTRSTGRDRSSFLSGLAPGQTRLHVRAVSADGNPGPWSEPLLIHVEYPSSRMVIGLMSLGSLLLLATLIIIVIGHRRSTREAFLAHGDKV